MDVMGHDLPAADGSLAASKVEMIARRGESLKFDETRSIYDLVLKALTLVQS